MNKTKNIIVVGAGVIGAVSAYYLQSAGAQVTIVDAGKSRATPASFGWVNASFYLNEDHFHLRNEGLAAYHRLSDELDIPINWSGCLCWENSGEAFDQQLGDLKQLKYNVEEIDAATFAELEPLVVNPPDRCLLFENEAAVESDELVFSLLKAATGKGARILNGVEVNGVIIETGCVIGVETNLGNLEADQVLIAAGTGSSLLSAKLNIQIPMLERPALVIKTRPVAQKIAHILVSEIGEVRQLPDGALLMPTTVSHQSSADSKIEERIDIAAEYAINRLREFLPALDLKLAEVMLAYRPVPADNLPVVGALKPGSYIATMHSGITLAAFMGELVSKEMLKGVSNETNKWLSPYRPQRFQSG